MNKKLFYSIIKPLAFVGRIFPKLVFNIRRLKANQPMVNWKSPATLQDYTVAVLYDKKTNLKLYADLADKVVVRDYVKKTIGEKYTNKLYSTWERAEDVDVTNLPDRFVLKTNNGCGTNFVIKDKSNLNLDKIKKELDFWIKFPYGELSGQKHYSLIKPLILAEEYLEQSTEDKDALPYDYKFFCIDGEPVYILFYEGRKVNGHITPNMLYDMDWDPIKEAVLRPTNSIAKKPSSFEEMKDCARKLSKGFPFVRVDFYEIGGKPIFGEMTFTPDIEANIKKDFSPLMKRHLNK